MILPKLLEINNVAWPMAGFLLAFCNNNKFMYDSLLFISVFWELQEHGAQYQYMSIAGRTNPEQEEGLILDGSTTMLV